VIDGAENEAAGIEQMKFYEVGPDISLTQHAITVRPIAFANATFERLTPEEQECVQQAGKAGGKLGRDTESGQDSEKLLELAGPVQDAYAEELGATEVLEAIRAVQ
jgi:TRAP-type C4-dicarboxylate transport system substrate-binding protein